MPRPLAPAHRPRLARGRARARACGGFTLIELVVTLTLVSVLALVAVPLYEVTVARHNESELRLALRQIRNALDAYKAAVDSGYVAKAPFESGYPPSLRILVEGVDTISTPVGTPGAAATGSSGSPGFNFGAPAGAGGLPQIGGSGLPPGGGLPQGANLNAPPTHMVFLRQVPRDPLFPDQTVAPEEQWNIRAYGSLPGDFSSGADVYDVSSKSEAIGLNGIAYKDW